MGNCICFLRKENLILLGITLLLSARKMNNFFVVSERISPGGEDIKNIGPCILGVMAGLSKMVELFFRYVISVATDLIRIMKPRRLLLIVTN